VNTYLERMILAGVVEILSIIGIIVTAGGGTMGQAFVVVFIIAGIYGVINFDLYMKDLKR